MFKHKIFWYKVFASREEADTLLANGRTYVKNIAGKKICVVKNQDQIFAIADRCPHNGASLSQGQCTEAGEIVCPLHRYHFSLQTGRTTKGMALAADVYKIETKEDGVFIGLEKLVFGW